MIGCLKIQGDDVLEKKQVRMGYNDPIKDMYDRVVTTIRTPARETSEFLTTIGLHHFSHMPCLLPYGLGRCI